MLMNMKKPVKIMNTMEQQATINESKLFSFAFTINDKGFYFNGIVYGLLVCYSE